MWSPVWSPVIGIKNPVAFLGVWGPHQQGIFCICTYKCIACHYCNAVKMPYLQRLFEYSFPMLAVMVCYGCPPSGPHRRLQQQAVGSAILTMSMALVLQATDLCVQLMSMALVLQATDLCVHFGKQSLWLSKSYWEFPRPFLFSMVLTSMENSGKIPSWHSAMKYRMQAQKYLKIDIWNLEKWVLESGVFDGWWKE